MFFLLLYIQFHPFVQYSHKTKAAKVMKSLMNILDKVPIQAEVIWVVMLCSIVVGHQHFRGPFRLHLQGEVMGTDIGL
jgi:hypothetical protein